MREEYKTLIDWWKDSQSVVFLGGAGVSTESGVPDFRSSDGIYMTHQNADEILTPGFMNRYPEEFYRFCRDFFMTEGILPNPAHTGLAKLEEAGKLDLVITQNIDGLHQAAGSKKVIELHGNTNEYSCTRCNETYDVDYVRKSELVPRCNKDSRFSDGACNGMLRPDIVLYEETLNFKHLQDAGAAIAKSDLLIVGGSSLTVWPAAGLIDYRRDGRLVVINKDATSRDDDADLVIREPIGEVFLSITKQILSA